MSVLALTLLLALASTPVTAPQSVDVPDGLTARDWSSLRGALEAGRRAVQPCEDGGHEAVHPGQRWRTRFDGRGFSVQPEGAEWSFGLELVRYGFAGAEVEVETPRDVRAEDQRLAYDWDATLEEWYVNGEHGLEHGYTVRRRPHGEGQLSFTLAVRGELRSEVANNGRDVRFVGTEGAALLEYSGLKVFDAEGNTLPARLESVAGGLLLKVDENEASYPLTIDPLVHQAYLKASNAEAEDEFGNSIAISGDTVVIGAPKEDSSATGVNGDESDNNGGEQGAAYVFVRSGSGWSQQAYLKRTGPGNPYEFGRSVAISGDTIVVGHRGYDGFVGAVHVFVRSGTTWTEQTFLQASNPDAFDGFGRSVSLSGETLVVGAPSESSSATGVNGDETDNSVPNAGAAYVFVRSGTSWSQEAYLKASNTDAGDLFGWTVAVADDTVVVGAQQEASSATGVNGNQNDDSIPLAGAAYVFLRSGTSWSQQAYLKASNTGADFFSDSLSLSGDTLAVGARREASNATGVNGDQNDDSLFVSGAVYVFTRSGTSWSQEAYVKASNPLMFGNFGWSVALEGDRLVVGAIGDNSAATGVNGDQNDGTAGSSGAAYVFERSGTSWSQAAYVKASNTGAGDQFGYSTSISGDTVVVGAPFERSSATGVNGDQEDDSLNGVGAAYVFEIGLCSDRLLAAELPGDPTLADFGGTLEAGPAINDPAEPFDLSLDCSGMATGGIYTIILRTGHLASPAATGFGNLWLSGVVLLKNPGVHGQNVVSWGAVTLPNEPAFVGVEYTAQGFCSQSGNGSRLSNGLVQTIGQ